MFSRPIVMSSCSQNMMREIFRSVLDTLPRCMMSADATRLLLPAGATIPIASNPRLCRTRGRIAGPASTTTNTTTTTSTVQTKWYSTAPTQQYPRTFIRQLTTKNRRKPKLDDVHDVEEPDMKPKKASSVLAPALATKISFRSARPEDCGAIYRLIKDFADLEGYSDRVEITEEDLVRDGFGEIPYFRCVVAEASGKSDATSVVGYALYNFCYCAWKGRMLSWEDIYVHEDYRGFGLGVILLQQVGKYAYEKGCNRLTGYVDATDPRLPQWYQDFGFVDFSAQNNYHIYSISDQALDNFVSDKVDPFKRPRSMGMDIDFAV